MKKISLMFIAFIFIFGCFGQSSSKEIIYGTVRTDGYQKITKGAMWAIRPEAKVIYEGGHPTGYTVVVLDQDYFVRFVDGENNQFDRNYIVFPKGSIVYTDDKTNQFHSAICGNKIEYIRPVNLVKIEKEQYQPQESKVFMDDDVVTNRVNWSYQQPSKPELDLTSTETVKQKTWLGKNWPYVAVGALAVGAGLFVADQNDWWRESPSGDIPFTPGGASVPQGIVFRFH